MPKKYLYLTLGIIFSLIFSSLAIYDWLVPYTEFPDLLGLPFFITLIPPAVLFHRSVTNISFLPLIITFYLFNLGYVFLIYWFFVSKKKLIPILVLFVVAALIIGICFYYYNKSSWADYL